MRFTNNIFADFVSNIFSNKVLKIENIENKYFIKREKSIILNVHKYFKIKECDRVDLTSEAVDE